MAVKRTTQYSGVDREVNTAIDYLRYTTVQGVTLALSNPNTHGVCIERGGGRVQYIPAHRIHSVWLEPAESENG